MKEMKRIFAPTEGPETWRGLLAKPATQWRDGYSAKELAVCWEKAWKEGRGFPPEMGRVFAAYGPPYSDKLELLLAIPEYQVKLPPDDRMPSCNDLFVLAKTCDGLVAIMVEGKASEPFGDEMGKWRSEYSDGKATRENAIKQELGITRDIPDTIRYQLLHRTASAVIEARRFGAPYAVMIVHSFSATDEWLPDYRVFLRELFDIAEPDKQLIQVADLGDVRLCCGWVHSDISKE